jgi:bifunctional UDP-N-acetylglucosamine pyrophosphorylase/glucosamine-1-phosphate N-acetyltransferase
MAVLLAAGAGRKFWPYNEVRNKCAFPIANEPLVARLARQLQSIGFSRLVVVVGSEEGSIRAALRPLGEASVAFVRAPAGATPGTATAVLSAINAVGDTQRALVVYADCVIATDDLRAVWHNFLEQQPPAGVLLAPLENERPQDWITTSLHTSNVSSSPRLRDIEGHGRDGSHRFAGAFALSCAAWPYLRAQPGRMLHVPVGGMPAPEAELADALATMTDDGLEIAGIVAQRPCVDVDKPWHIFEATEAVLHERAEMLTESRIDPTAQISDGAEISGPIVVEAGATIGKRVVLEGPAWIGAQARVVNGAIVGAKVIVGRATRISDYCLVNEGSVVGNECVVGHGGEFDGVMLDRSYIYHYSEIYGVLGLAVDIGAATVCGTLRFDDGETVHRLYGRREFPRNGANATYFGDYVRTGVNVITQPGVKIGAYSCVGPGIVLYQDVSNRKLMLLKQEVVERDWGPERYGW